MKIVCDNCSAKYQISDEKVRNKVFKIRCKKCSHVIVVRADQQDSGFDAPADEPAPAAEDQTRVADYPEEQEPGAEAIWYVVINREQVGPLTRRQVEGHFEAGDIDADTFTWAEGMGDWIRLGAVPEFAHLAPSTSEPASSSFEATPRPVTGGGGGGGVFAGLDDGDDVMVSNNQNQSARAESLFGNDREEEFSHSPRVSGGQSLRNQRNENSVLFSLDSLAGEVERSPRVSNTGGSEGSGLIDISALAGGGGGGASRAPDLAVSDDAFGGGAPAFAPVSAAPVGAPMPTFVTQRKSNTGKIAAMVAAALILLGGAIVGTMHFMKDSGGQQQAVAANAPATAPDRVEVAGDGPAKPAAAPETVKPKAEAPPPEAKPAEAPAAAENGTAEAKPEEAPAEAEVAKAPEARPAAAPKPRARAERERRPAAPSRPAARAEDAPPPAPPPVAAAPRPRAEARPAARPARKSGGEVDALLGALDGNGGGQRRPPAGGQPAAAPVPSGAPALPDKLSRTQILTVVKQNAGAIASCKDREPGVSGTVMVKMVIATGGNVSSANVVTGQFKGSPVGNCVEGKVRAFRFPQFAGPDPMQINMPFSL